jgi:hypothetical protein
MKNPHPKLSLFASAVLCGTLLMGAGTPQTPPKLPHVDDIGFCKPYTWLWGGWVAAPRLPLLGDINGDGYADFIYATPGEKIVDVSLNGKGWKPMRGQRLVSGLPEEIRSLCFAHLGGTALDIAVLGANGGLQIAKSVQSGQYPTNTRLGAVSGISGKAWIFAGKVVSKKLDDLIVVDSVGHVQVLDASGAKREAYSLGVPVTNAAAGDVTGDGTVKLAVRTGGSVILYRMAKSAVKIATITAPPGQEALAMGDINADGKADVLVNGKVFIAPNFKKTVAVPGWEKFDKPVIAMMADVAGHPNGRADVVVQHEGPDYYGSAETDCDLYVTYFKSDTDWDCDGLSNVEEMSVGSDPLDRSTSHDGIPDGWKVHGFDGVDLKAMGASPLHKDVFVMNLIYDTVPADQVERQMRERVAPFFANLQYTNLDGTKGFALHWITQTPALPAKQNEGKSWQRIAGEKFPQDKIGLYHWMLVGGLGGGGQSDQLADSGSSGMGSWIHEFGHQLGLSHSGKYQTWAPTYTSLMNYSYSYQFDGDGRKVHFSNGEFASLVLNESHLPGKVPFPIEKLRFLEGPPYRLHLQSAGNDATYVDWGWTGVFSDKTIRANITYGYSVSGGERLQPSGTQGFHYDGPFELMTDYQASLCEHQGKLYMVTANRGPVDPKAPRPKSASLVLQTYLGKHAWSTPTTIGKDVTNDPYAASDGRFFYVFYPTDDGIKYRFGSPDALSEPQPIPDSKGAYPSAVNWNGTLHLFLFRGADENITYRTVWKTTLGPIVDMGFKSTIPPGPAVDTIHGQLLLGTATPVGNQPYRWQLRRFDWSGAAGFKQVSENLVGGSKSGWAGNRRPTVIFNPSSEFGPQGKIYWIATGTATPLTTPTAFFVAQTIGYKDVNDGWLLWRYYDEWTNTRSGIGAAWFDNDITLATTWASGTVGGDCGVFCAYNGMAIGNVDMGDFDDISLMANYGMFRSIGTFAQIPKEGVSK